MVRPQCNILVSMLSIAGRRKADHPVEPRETAKLSDKPGPPASYWAKKCGGRTIPLFQERCRGSVGNRYEKI